jgi:hypothetical protein
MRMTVSQKLARRRAALLCASCDRLLRCVLRCRLGYCFDVAGTLVCWRLQCLFERPVGADESDSLSGEPGKNGLKCGSLMT